LRIYEKKEVTVVKNIEIGISCDVCGGKIDKDFFYQITTGHEDWGNDSVESIEERDVCSDECLRAELEAYLEEKHLTKYFEIERQKLPERFKSEGGNK